MNQRERREWIIKKIRDSYREIRKIERLLASKRFLRQFKDERCKAALAQTAARKELATYLHSERAILLRAFCELPEIECDKSQQLFRRAEEFARSLSAKRSPRYMKSQLQLVQ